MEAKDDELLTNFGATRCSIWGLELDQNWPDPKTGSQFNLGLV